MSSAHSASATMVEAGKASPAPAPHHVLFWMGGFAPVGGIEQFARDFLVELAESFPSREMVGWGQSAARISLLEDIVRSGARLTYSPMRWGCRWDLPNRWIGRRSIAAIARANVVVLGKLPPLDVLLRMRAAAGSSALKPKFVYVTSYRPCEMWPSPPDPRVFDCIDCMVVQAKLFRQDMEKFGFRGRFELINNVPPAYSPPAPMPVQAGGGKLRLGFLGRLAAQKNIDYMLEVIDALRKLDGAGAFELHLFGDGVDAQRLEQKSKTMGLSELVFFHGRVSRDRVFATIDSCDFFLNTARSEGQPLSTLETLSRGRPLIATPVGCHPELLSNPLYGRIAPEGDAAAYAAQVLAMAQEVRSRAITAEMISAEFQREHGRDVCVAKFDHLLRDLIAQSLAGR